MSAWKACVAVVLCFSLLFQSCLAQTPSNLDIYLLGIVAGLEVPLSLPTRTLCHYFVVSLPILSLRRFLFISFPSLPFTSLHFLSRFHWNFSRRVIFP